MIVRCNLWFVFFFLSFVPSLESRAQRLPAQFISSSIDGTATPHQEPWGLNYTLDVGLDATGNLPLRPPLNAFSSDFRNAIQLAEKEESEASLQKFEQALAAEKNLEKKSIIAFAQGTVLYKLQRFSNAEQSFKAALPHSRVPEYIRFMLALTHKQMGDFAQAHKDLESIATSQSPQSTRLEARLQMAEILLAEGKARQAAREYQGLLRKFRTSESYPYVLFQFLRAEQKAEGRIRSCKWARDLFAKYSAHAVVSHWSSNLRANEIDGQPTRCTSTLKDLQNRIRRLQFGGESARVLGEISVLRAQSGGSERNYSVDSLMANHLISEGRTDEAIKILNSYYESQKNNSGFLLLLAKASMATGAFETAAGNYYRAYQLSPRSKKSRDALFQSAFVSYQFQDYDGASRRFQQFIKSYGNAPQARDARWYLAWIRYLRGDFARATIEMAELNKPQRRRKRREKPSELTATDRLQYWMAMSRLKAGKVDDALPTFIKLAADPGIGYYAVLSQFRLNDLAASNSQIKQKLSQLKSSSAIPALSEAELAEAAANTEASVAEESVNEAREAEAQEAEENGEAGAAEAVANGDVDVSEDLSPFQDAMASQRFERARDLAIVGLSEFARRELAEVERRSRSSHDKKSLMSEYTILQNYHRSSYIGETYFGVQRLKGGLQGARGLWEYTYPRAYNSVVTESVRNFKVPEELVWGIMRAESHYRQDAQSAVGALGLMQIMPYTGRQLAGLLGVTDFRPRQLLDPETNIRLGTRYLQRLLDNFSGSIPLVAAGYNAGPHRVQSWLKAFGRLDMDEFVEHIPFRETRNYVKRVVRNVQTYSLLYSGPVAKTKQLESLVKPVTIKFEGDFPTRELW